MDNDCNGKYSRVPQRNSIMSIHTINYFQGAIGSGKFIVRADFIHKSFEAKKFLREDEFIPSDIVILRSAFNKHGKIFLNQSCVILMENNKKQIELRNMVRDSGGAVLNWSCKDLALKRDVELMKVDFIVSN